MGLKTTMDAYTEMMQPIDDDTAIVRLLNHLRAYSLKHRDALGYPVGATTLPAWDITNNLVEKAKRWMVGRYSKGLPLTFREMLDLAVLIDDAVAEAEIEDIGFWGMDAWNDHKEMIEGMVAAKFTPQPI
jgi:hypothetical protein